MSIDNFFAKWGKMVADRMDGNPPPAPLPVVEVRWASRPWSDSGMTPVEKPKGHRRVKKFVPSETLAVTCWCERERVQVPVAEVGRSTLSCGRPHCKAPS